MNLEDKTVRPIYRAVIFDMDGTVLDTLKDLKIALNYALMQTGHRHDYSLDEVKFFFGSGIRSAIRRAFAVEGGMSFSDPAALLAIQDSGETTEDEFERILKIYRPYYGEHCNDNTAPYPGVLRLLQNCREAGIRTAVVSNKPDYAVQILVREQFPGLFDYAIGEREGIPRKPSPEMVLEAMKALGVPLENTLFVGDSEIDLQTAQNAGLDCAAVTWGFRPREILARMNPKYIVDSCPELESYTVKAL